MTTDEKPVRATSEGRSTPAPGRCPAAPGRPAAARPDGPSRGSTRRDFFASVALAAAILGCRGSPAARPADRSPTPAPPADPSDLSPDIRAVRDHVLRLETPPSFVFTTRFRDVP